MKELIELSKKIQFESVLVTEPNWREKPKGYELQAYLWMCELQKWLIEKKDVFVLVFFDAILFSVSIYGRGIKDEIIFKSESLTKENSIIYAKYEQALKKGLIEAIKILNLL